MHWILLLNWLRAQRSQTVSRTVRVSRQLVIMHTAERLVSPAGASICACALGVRKSVWINLEQSLWFYQLNRTQTTNYYRVKDG